MRTSVRKASFTDSESFNPQFCIAFGTTGSNISLGIASGSSQASTGFLSGTGTWTDLSHIVSDNGASYWSIGTLGSSSSITWTPTGGLTWGLIYIYIA